MSRSDIPTTITKSLVKSESVAGATIKPAQATSDVNVVSNQVAESKKEIENLKAELQRLLNNGLKNNSNLAFTNNWKNNVNANPIMNDLNLKQDEGTVEKLNKENRCKKKLNEHINENIVPTSVTCRRRIQSSSPKHNRNLNNASKSPRNKSSSPTKSIQAATESNKVSMLHKTPPKSVTVRRRLISQSPPPPPPVQKKSNSSEDNKLEKSPQKQTYYDSDAMREYIKKQRHDRYIKHKEELAEKQKLEEEKKQKLKELQQKTDKIFSKNVKNAKKFCSNRNIAQSANIAGGDCMNGFIFGERNALDEQQQQVTSRRKPVILDGILAQSDEFFISSLRKPHVSRSMHKEHVSRIDQVCSKPHHHQYPTKDVPVKDQHPQAQVSASTSKVPSVDANQLQKNPEKLSVPSVTLLKNVDAIKKKRTEERTKAATKIQSVYRGYRQRQVYRKVLEITKRREEEARRLSENFLAKKHHHHHHHQEDASVQTPPLAFQTAPKWLQPAHSLPYPYNFITAVKRKLNLAVNNNINTAESGTQCTPNASLRDCRDVKDAKVQNSDPLNDSNNKSNRPNLDLRAVESLALTSKNNSMSESDTSRNVPEISEESVKINPLQKIENIINNNRNNTKLDVLDIHPHMNPPEAKSAASEDNIKSSLQEKNANASILINYFNSMSNRSNSTKNSNQTKASLVLSLKSKSSKTGTNSDDDFSTDKEEKSFKSLNVETEESDGYRSSSSQIIKTSYSQRNKDVEDKYSSDFESSLTKSVPSLKRPSVSLQSSRIITEIDAQSRKGGQTGSKEASIKLKSNDNSECKSNQIHLKFEAELRLLESGNNNHNNSFSEALASQKAATEIQNKNTMLQNKDTQTRKPSGENNSKSENHYSSSNKSRSTTASNCSSSKHHHLNASFVNYSRGSDDVSDNFILSLDNASAFKDLSCTDVNLNDTMTTTTANDTTVDLFKANKSFFTKPENLLSGMSIGLFDQLIKEEDARIENLKQMCKIREQTLCDKTRGEIYLLEIKKKALKDKGQKHEASLVKKRQRGLLLKLENEKHELHRLRELNKAVSLERKTQLKEQKNLIKAQLTAAAVACNSSSTSTKIRRKSSTSTQRRHSGPIKVYKNRTEIVESETSFSCKSSISEEVHSKSLVTRSVTETESVRSVTEDNESDKKEDEDISVVSGWTTVDNSKAESTKRALLTREAALQRRRKTAEEHLRWHNKLLEEESRVKKLEEELAATAAASAARNKPTKSNDPSQDRKNQQRKEELRGGDATSADNKRQEQEQEGETFCFSGSQLNLLWQNMTGKGDKKFVDDKSYAMSKMALERFCKDARRQALKQIKRSHVEEQSVKFGESKAEGADLQEDVIDNVDKTAGSVDGKVLDIIDSSFLVNSIDSTVTEDDSIADIRNSVLDSSRSAATVSVVSQKNSTKADGVSVEDVHAAIETASNSAMSIGTSLLVEEEIEEQPSSIKTDSNSQRNKSVDSSINTNSSIISSVKQIEVEQETAAAEVEEEDEIIESPKKSTDTVQTDYSTNFEEDVESLAPSQNSADEDVGSVRINVAQEDVIEEVASEKTSPLRSPSETEQCSPVKVVEEKEEDAAKPKAGSEDSEEYVTTQEDLSSINASSEEESKRKIEEDKVEQKSEGVIHVDVRKRVSEILADANSTPPRDQSPRLQDLYVTTYDILSPSEENSPEFGSPNDSGTSSDKSSINSELFGNEAEELFRKQLAIEEEIKEIEKQQKEQLPYLFVREIPNKPPPPYTPPTTTASLNVTPPVSTIIPKSSKEVHAIVSKAAKHIYDAYVRDALDQISFRPSDIYAENVSEDCCHFLFNLCKELALEHYSKAAHRMKTPSGPTWMQIEKKLSTVSLQKPMDRDNLAVYMSARVKQLLDMMEEPPSSTTKVEKLTVKWRNKKRDHVDELLVLESQAEEAEWTNYDEDELIVKNDVTNELFDMLLAETAQVVGDVLQRRTYLF